MVPLGVSLSLLLEDQGPVEVNLSAILNPFDSNWFMWYPWSMSLSTFNCHLTQRFGGGGWSWIIHEKVGDFPDSSVGKESACNAEDPGSIPGLGRSAGEGIGYPLYYSWASLVAQLIKNLLQCGRPGFYPWVGKIPWRRKRLPTPVFWPGECHGLCSPWGLKESDTTEQLSLFTYANFKESNKGRNCQSHNAWQ